ncbi:MAG: hypothetical protein ACE366_22860 [Bradymonadia bacterium]
MHRLITSVLALCIVACAGCAQGTADQLEIEGTCSKAPPIAYTDAHRQVRAVPEKRVYQGRVRVRENALGFARLRSNPVFPESDVSNVLAEVPMGTEVLTLGPAKNGEFSAGIGWSVIVEGADGRTCMGYLSSSVVDVTEL